MNDINSVALSGRLAKDAEVKDFGDSKKHSFPLAVGYSVKQDGQWTEKTSYIDCEFWCKGDKIAGFLKKGLQIFCSGQIVQNKWQSEDGSMKSRIIVKVSNISLGKESSGKAARNAEEVPF